MKSKEQTARELAGCYLSINITCDKCGYYEKCNQFERKELVLASIKLAEQEMIEKLKKGYCKNCDITLNYAACTENQMCNSLNQIINLLNS